MDSFNLANKDISDLNLDTTIKNINKKIDLIAAFKQGNSLYNDILGPILSTRPEGVTLTQLLYSQRKDKSLAIEIHGVARDRITLRNFKTIIDSNPHFASSSLPINNYLDKTNLDFNITAILK